MTTFDLSQIDINIAAQYLFFGFCMGVVPTSFAWGLRLLLRELMRWKK